MRLVQEYTVDIEHRFKYATITVIVLFLIVLARLFYLQVMRGSFYQFFSSENSIKEIRIPAARGMTFDRHGKVLVENRSSLCVTVIPQYVADPAKLKMTLTTLLGMTPEEVDAAWARRKQQPSYQPLVIKKDVSLEEASLIRAHKNPWETQDGPYDLRGVEVELRYQRIYPESNIVSHVLGYVREIDPKKLAIYRDQYPGRYRSGDEVGVGGIEESWDTVLRGQDGFEQRVIDAMGREVDYEGISAQLIQQPALPGSSLKLTIDRDLQMIARDLFGARNGGAVAIDPDSGAVLALFSSPSYDMNRLSGPEGGAYWKELLSGKNKAMLNRAIQGGYPPGSTYKIVTATAALSEGVVKPDETVNCGGALVYGGRAFHCWGVHGPISIHRAIVSSCDVYFYQMGLRLGVDRLAKYANLLGLGHKTGVPLPGEKGGLIPTSAWKEKRFGVPWQRGEDLSISVGQGYNVVVPIQNALLASHIANGGKEIELHLVDSVYDVKGQETYRWKPSGERSLGLDPQVLDIVKKGMAGVVAEAGGTAHRLSTYSVPMGGKTGTAQVYQFDSAAGCRAENCKDHAWFIGFAPVEHPVIAMAVVVEHGGFGAAAAAPIVGAMMQHYVEELQSGEGALIPRKQREVVVETRAVSAVPELGGVEDSAPVPKPEAAQEFQQILDEMQLLDVGESP
jgi:penicillin-binding protein 2